MTAAEFSNQFDLLYNNISSNQSAGLNEYEKSVFLTKAQNELLLNRFDKDSQGNTVKKGFDESAVRQMNFANLMKTAKCPILNTQSTSGTSTVTTLIMQTDQRSLLYSMPSDVFIVINETMQLSKTVGIGDDAETIEGTRQVVPIAYDEYIRLMSKPFKEPLKWQAWRLINSASTTGHLCEIILTSYDKSFYTTKNYIVRYVKKPKPIILTDLSTSLGENLSIEGKHGKFDEGYTVDASTNLITNPCELDSSTHEAILQRAVELAKVAWEGDVNVINEHITSGQRSE